VIKIPQTTNSGHAPAEHLLAILCNPPLRSPETMTSWKNLTVLQQVLGAATFDILNVIDQPTRSTTELEVTDGQLDLYLLESRVRAAAQGAGTIVAAWGTRAPGRWPRYAWQDLIQATGQGLQAAGHSRLLHVGPTPRHPSRWRQHTSPVHCRYPGDTFEQRLLAALHDSSVAALTGNRAL